MSVQTEVAAVIELGLATHDVFPGPFAAADRANFANQLSMSLSAGGLLSSKPAVDSPSPVMPQPGDEGWETPDGEPLTIIAVNGVDVWASWAEGSLSGIWTDSVFGWPSWVRTPPAPIFPERWIPVYRESGAWAAYSSRDTAVWATQKFVSQRPLGILHLLPSGETEMLPPA